MTMRPLSLAALLACAATALIAVPIASGTRPGYQSKPDPRIVNGSVQRALDGARKRWKHAGVASYSYKLDVSCFCPPMNDIRMVVRNRRPSGQTRRGYDDQATIPRVFATIQDAIDAKVAKLDVTYGARGVPRRVYIDRDDHIADEEVGYAIRGFAPLKR